MTIPAQDPIFAAIGEFQARLAVTTYARSPAAAAAQARAEAALLETRATTPDGLRAGMCFRIEAAAVHLQEADDELAGPTWSLLRRAAAGKSVAPGLCGVISFLAPGFFTDLLRSALVDALELEQAADGDRGQAPALTPLPVEIQAAA
jgi:hypothetical protein